MEKPIIQIDEFAKQLKMALSYINVPCEYTQEIITVDGSLFKKHVIKIDSKQVYNKSEPIEDLAKYQAQKQAEKDKAEAIASAASAELAKIAEVDSVTSKK